MFWMVCVRNGYALKKIVGCKRVIINYILTFSLFSESLVHCTANKFGCTMYWYNNMLSIFRISITTDKENNEYQFTHSVLACYVPGTCDQTYNIFQDTKFSIKTCDYTGGFLDSSMYFKSRYNWLKLVNILSYFHKKKIDHTNSMKLINLVLYILKIYMSMK